MEKKVNFKISFSDIYCNVSRKRCQALLDIEVDDPAYNSIICMAYGSFLDYTNVRGYEKPTRCDACKKEFGAN